MMTVKDAVKQIDTVLGQGYAEANPTLIGAVLQADALQDIDTTLVEALQSLVNIAGFIKIKVL